MKTVEELTKYSLHIILLLVLLLPLLLVLPLLLLLLPQRTKVATTIIIIITKIYEFVLFLVFFWTRLNHNKGRGHCGEEGNPKNGQRDGEREMLSCGLIKLLSK